MKRRPPSRPQKARKRPGPLKRARSELEAAAIAMMKRAYAPYSRFRVGAALRADSGQIFTGCNVENSSYGLSVCAERVAMSKAVSEGERSFVEIVIATASERPSPPCGACRQFLSELAPNLRVVLVTPDGAREKTTLAALLPKAFDRGYL